jgi:polygalacturonase
MTMMKVQWAMFAAGLIAPVSLCAQDTRVVTEPKIPPSCVVLKAELSKGFGLADESKPDTARVQAAIDGCDTGKAVEFANDGGKNAFLIGPINMRAGVTLAVDKGVTVYGSRTPKDYEMAPGSCGINNEKTGCRALIAGKNTPHSGIMGDGVIDGRGGAKMIVDGKETGHTWWDLGFAAKTEGHQQVPRLLQMDQSDDFTLYRITLKNAAMFHVSYSHGDGFTIWGLKIDTPEHSPNTDGVDPSASKNITMAYSYIRDGDDNIAIKGGAEPGLRNMTVIHNHFYYGHGMSIGSETTAGVSQLRVTDLSLDGTTQGIRIKSQQAYGGLVHDAVYEDVCIRGSKIPIMLDTNYSANPKPGQGLIPVFKDITLKNVRVAGGGKIQLNAFDATHRIGITFDGVTLDSPSAYKFEVNHADIIYGPGPVNFMISGADSTLRNGAGKGKLDSCSEKFVPFPVVE